MTVGRAGPPGPCLLCVLVQVADDACRRQLWFLHLGARIGCYVLKGPFLRGANAVKTGPVLHVILFCPALFLVFDYFLLGY